MSPAADDRWFRRVLWGLMVLYTVSMVGAQLVKYDSLQMGFDVALYEQIIWNTAHGRFFQTSIFRYTTSSLGQDITLMHALVAIPYRLFPSTETLLVLETIAVSLGALPLYLLARDKLGPGVGLALAFSYLAYPPLQQLNLYEYQPRAIVLGLVFAMFHFLERGSLRGFVVSAALILTSRIDTALTVAAFGAYALLKGKPKAFGLSALGLGLGWFATVVYVITPHFNALGRMQYLSWYAYLGRTPGEILTTFLTRPLFVLENMLTPEKRAFLADVYGEVLFLPALRPDVLLLAAPTLAQCLLSPKQIQWDIRYQYPAMLYPTAFLATVMAIAMLGKLVPAGRARLQALVVRSMAGAVVAGTLAGNVLVGSPAVYWLALGRPPHLEKVQRLAALIPPDAPLAVDSKLGPRVSRREHLYIFPPNDEFYSDQGLNKADYVFLDAWEDADDPAYLRLKRDPAWVLLAKEGRFRLFKRATPEERARGHSP